MDVQTATIVVTGIGVLIAAVSQIYTNRQANQQRAIELKNQELTLHAQQQALETRQAELFMQLYSKWTSPEFRVGLLKMYQHWSWSDFSEFQAKYGAKTNAEDFVAGVVVPASFYEGIGVLVERGLIDVTLVNRLLRRNILLFWERLGPVIQGYRKEQEQDEQPIFDSVEYLYHELQKLESE